MRIIAILMILTLSSCMVSKKVYDKKCCEVDELKAQVDELKGENDAWKWKDQICRQHVLDITNELKALKDTTKVIEQLPDNK
jgi:outer membrane murein-binding lipoprotein Lpp